jgi:hypothetical protein
MATEARPPPGTVGQGCQRTRERNPATSLTARMPSRLPGDNGPALEPEQRRGLLTTTCGFLSRASPTAITAIASARASRRKSSRSGRSSRCVRATVCDKRVSVGIRETNPLQGEETGVPSCPWVGRHGASGRRRGGAELSLPARPSRDEGPATVPSMSVRSRTATSPSLVDHDLTAAVGRPRWVR